MKKKIKVIPMDLMIEEAEKDPIRKARMEKYQEYYDYVTAFYAARKKLMLTQKELSKKTGVPVSIISKVENGSRNATLSTLTKLAHGMGKRIEIKLVDEK